MCASIFSMRGDAAHKGAGRSRRRARFPPAVRRRARAVLGAYAARSWATVERSREASGLPLVYLLKTLIPLFAVLLGLQGVAQAIRAALVLLGPARSRHADSLAKVLAVAMVVAVCALLLAGYPVALTLGRRVARCSPPRALRSGVMDLALLGALPQRIFGIMTNEVLLAIPLFIFMGVMLERSRDRRGIAGNHGPAVRRAARRPRHLGGRRRRAARRGQGHRRRHHGDHGADRAADHAAARLRQGARRRHGRGDRDAGADFSAGDRAGAARRPAQQFLSGRATGAGQFRAADGVGRRPVRRRDHSRPRAGRALSALSGRRRDLVAGKIARRSRPTRRRRTASRWCAGSARCWSRRSR